MDVAEALTCWAKGGFGSATVLVCGMFSAISGSDAAGAAAVGRMTIDRLVESGYPRPYACALVAAGACTGILIPPSIAYIIDRPDPGHLGLDPVPQARLIPGVLIMLSIMVTNIVDEPDPHAYRGRKARAILGRRWAGNIGRGSKGGWYALSGPGVIIWAASFRDASHRPRRRGRRR